MREPVERVAAGNEPGYPVGPQSHRGQGRGNLALGQRRSHQAGSDGCGPFQKFAPRGLRSARISRVSEEKTIFSHQYHQGETAVLRNPDTRFRRRVCQCFFFAKSARLRGGDLRGRDVGGRGAGAIPESPQDRKPFGGKAAKDELLGVMRPSRGSVCTAERQ